jgi:tRNA/tmRNA/rRNA uracil-C5-methylase (TrmA/RlmC/RlmD family)
LAVTDLAFGGEGVARLDEFVIFVPFTAVGDTVEVEITEVKKRFARGKITRILGPSPDRVQPPCPYFGICGGCQYQHLSYAAQLQAKHKQVSDLFQRLAHINGDIVQPVIPCPQEYGYRNRIMIRSQWDKFKQGLNIGYIRADSRLVVDIDSCLIAEPALNEEIKRVKQDPPPKGGLKVVLRIPPEGWHVPPDSFFQNNFHLLPKMVELVRERFRSGGARHLVDVYCGVGFFAIELADLVEGCVGVEVDLLAVKAARRNAAVRSRRNCEFVAGAVEDLLPELVSRFSPQATAVLLDPPRKGCQNETLELLRRVRPKQVIYVSCHPATMARDLNILCGQDVFKLAQVIPLDMFPQTMHVECVADLRSSSNGPTGPQTN